MKICFYSPYIPGHFGGGEKYLLDCARILSSSHQVFLAINQTKPASLLQKYEDFLGTDLSHVQVVASPLGKKGLVLKKLLWTRQFDVMYYLTDGSLFFSGADRNILHIQVPLLLNKSGWLEKLKLKNWHIKNTNSIFTKRVVEKSWPTQIDFVHQPMIEPTELAVPDLKQKQKIILHIGRFFSHLHSKKQLGLVEICCGLRQQQPDLMKGWRLVMIGGVEDEAYFKQVKTAAEGLPVEFYQDLNRDEIIKWLKKSSLYWHATGLGVDESQHPEQMEHFGISTLEAMAAGSAPVVIGKGGQPEILGRGLASQLWQISAECQQKTLALLKSQRLRLNIQRLAAQRAQRFSPSRFEHILKEMIKA